MLRWVKTVETAEELLPHIPESGRTFFYENVVVQARRGLGAVRTLVKAIEAVDALTGSDVDNVESGEEACWAALAEARSALDMWEGALGAADRSPKWETWSKSDRIVLPGVVREQLLAIEHLVKARFGVEHSGLHAHLKRGTLTSDASVRRSPHQG